MSKLMAYYLDREVLYKSTSLYENQLIPKLSTATVLLCFDKAHITNKQFEEFFKTIIQEEPLSITICGANADKHFEVLLEILSIAPQKKHIMTYISKSEQCLDDFFLASWPAEERHNEWQRYVVIEAEGSELGQTLKNYLQA